MEREQTATSASGAQTRREFLRRSAATAATAAVTAGMPQIALGQTKGANDRLGIGFIGCGGRQGAHLQAIHWLKNHGKEAVDLVAVCDVYRPRMQGTAKHYKAKGYTDHRELLKDSNVDVVAIATPDHHHAPQAIDAFEAGKDVYCEKPFTHWRQFELAKKAAQIAQRKNRVFQLGTQGMSDSTWHQAAKLIKDGLIGQPIHAECGYFRVGDWGERGMPIPDRNVKPGGDLNWEAFLGDSPKRPFDVSRFFRWRMYEDYSGGPVTDLFPHSFTPVVYMLGVGLPSLAVATGGKFRYPDREVPDTFNMLVDYPQKATVAVLGTQGNNHSGTGDHGAGGRSPIVRGWDGTLTFRGNQIVFTPAAGCKKKPRQFKIERGENLVDHWKNLLDGIRKRDRRTNSPIELAYHVQTALNMAMLSLRNGKTARFDAKKQEIVI